MTEASHYRNYSNLSHIASTLSNIHCANLIHRLDGFGLPKLLQARTTDLPRRHYYDDVFRRRCLSEFSHGKTLHFSVVPQFLSPPLLIHRRYPPLDRFLFIDAARLI